MLVMVVLVVEATAVEFAVRGNNYKGELLNSGVMFVSFRELFQILGAHSSLLFTATWCPFERKRTAASRWSEWLSLKEKHFQQRG